MKKLIFSAAVLASAFFAASCQQEMLDPQAEGTTVTYTVDVPNAIATKAIGDQITAVDKVYFEVYRAADVNDLSKSPVYQGEKPVINNSASFPLEFVKGQEFVVLFWAQNSALVNTDVTSDAGMYNINDLRQIQLVNPGAANNDAAQVFAGKDTVSDCVSAAKGNVTLTRPVSQINVYTTTESLSFGDVKIGLSTSDMTVAGLYNTYNVATGDAVEADENESTFVYAEAAVPTATADNAALKYVAMNYVGFAPKNGTTVNVGFNIQTTEAVKIKHSVSNVPVKPNYRTNIQGNLISATTDYNVSLDDKWAATEISCVSDAIALQDAIIKGGQIEIINDITVDKWIMFSEDYKTSDGTIITIKEINVTINGNGHTLTINDIESGNNGNQLFQGATNLNISNLTIKYADGLNSGGIGLNSGVIENVHFVGGGGAIYPGEGNIKIENCTFATKAHTIYYEAPIDNLTVTGCTFNLTDNANVILLRGKENFTNNIINSGRTVNVVSGSPVVTGNNFNDVRFKVYTAATAYIAKNTINVLEFDKNTAYSSYFADDNILSDAAKALLKNMTAETPYVSTYDELVAAVKKGGEIKLANDITVDKWIMFSEDYKTSDGTIITIDDINVTINGNGHTLTINDIESGNNGSQLFQGATNLNISNLTIKYADGLNSGGIGLNSGVIENVHFVGGGSAIYPGEGNIKIDRCTFATMAHTIYYEAPIDNLTVTGCTFTLPANANVILLRGKENFTNNIINSGRTVNVVSGSPVVTGNNFNDVRFKVYSAATATISNNTINVLEFETTTYSSTFTGNTLSPAAQAALDAATRN